MAVTNKANFIKRNAKYFGAAAAAMIWDTATDDHSLAVYMVDRHDYDYNVGMTIDQLMDIGDQLLDAAVVWRQR